MKRYDIKDCYRCGALCQEMDEDPDGEYYSRADLIAAGVLVPVLDGEACRYAWLQDSVNYIMVDGGLYKPRPSPSMFVFSVAGDVKLRVEANTIVQPVRLVRLEDVE